MVHPDTYCDICGLLKSDTQKLTFQQLKDLDVCPNCWVNVQTFLDAVAPTYTATQAAFKAKGW
jgi:hypothetical protein